jgi:hypothetical protein
MRRRNKSMTFVQVKDGRRNDTGRSDEQGMIGAPVRYKHNVPLMVGTVRHFTANTPEGRWWSSTRGKIRQAYYTVTMEILGSSPAIGEEHRRESGHVAPRPVPCPTGPPTVPGDA